MNEDATHRIRATVDAVYRAESRRVLATLIRRVGDFDLAEEVLHEAFRAALEQWPRDGVPANPRAWLVSVGRFKAIDRLRQRGRFDSLDDAARPVAAPGEDALAGDGESVVDDLLRLIFTCCHPAWVPDAQATDPTAIDWTRIVGFYSLRIAAEPSPVVALNRAVAVAMRDGPAAGLALIDALLAGGELADYHLAHAARADLCRRLGRTIQARAAYERALSLTQQAPEQRFLLQRLRELSD